MIKKIVIVLLLVSLVLSLSAPAAATGTELVQTIVFLFLENVATEWLEAHLTTAPACPVEREGYDFIGWNTQPDGSGVTYLPGDSLNGAEQLSLYAQWEYTGVVVELAPRPFLTTPFDDYSVTEGLLLLIVVMLFLGFIIKTLGRLF